MELSVPTEDWPKCEKVLEKKAKGTDMVSHSLSMMRNWSKEY